MQILLIDDKEEIAQLFQFNFTRTGHPTVIASDGAQALALLRDESAIFDVIILDYQMPGMDGLEVVRELRQIERHKDVPVLLLTGYAAGRIPNDPTLGINRVLEKPIVPSQLLAVVEEVVNGS